MSFFRDKMSPDEKAVQRKIERGSKLENDDRKIIQARMAALQRRGIWNGRSGTIPTNALNKNISVQAGALASAMTAHANGMLARGNGAPDNMMSLVSSNIMTQVNALGQNGSAGFSFTAQSTRGLNCTWTIAGTLEVHNMQARSSGAGAGGHGYGGGTGTTAGSGSANTSGWGVNGGAGVTSSAGASVGASASGVGVGAGQSTTMGASVGAGYSSSTTTSVSSTSANSGSATGGHSGNVMREQYVADIVCNFSMSYEFDSSWWNPVSWGAQVGSAMSGTGTERAGSASCGTATFEVDEPTT